LEDESELLKTGFLHKKVVQFPPRNRAGMTLIEVVVALAIAGLMVAGIVTGYIFCSTSTIKDSLYMAANARAMERIEETQSAQWDTSISPAVDQLVASNFLPQTVTLNISGSDPNVISATVNTDISQISLLPPLKRIHVDCIWQFQGGDFITNSIETCRAPD
jgi:prepilin-type N-terminal cleavage/methylation domain-containing protein